MVLKIRSQFIQKSLLRLISPTPDHSRYPSILSVTIQLRYASCENLRFWSGSFRSGGGLWLYQKDQKPPAKGSLSGLNAPPKAGHYAEIISACAWRRIPQLAGCRKRRNLKRRNVDYLAVEDSKSIIRFIWTFTFHDSGCNSDRHKLYKIRYHTEYDPWLLIIITINNR